MRWSTHSLLLFCHGGRSRGAAACLCTALASTSGQGGEDTQPVWQAQTMQEVLFSCIALGHWCLLQSKGFVCVQYLATELWHLEPQQCVFSHQVPCEIDVNVSTWTNLWIWLRPFGLTVTLLWSPLPSDLRKKRKSRETAACDAAPDLLGMLV